MGSAIDLSKVGTKLSREDARFQQESVADLLGRTSLAFPGAQPVSFARHHIDELQHVDYFLCEKTDGVRCLLYLTQFVDEQNEEVELQFLIDRKNDYYCLPLNTLHIPTPLNRPPGFDVERFHKGTLLDGELVLQRTPHGGAKLAYLIFDMLAVDMEDITSKEFAKRFWRAEQLYKAYRKFAEDPHFRDDVQALQPFEVQLKKMEMPYAAEMMFRDKIPKLPHGNDGLIFTCVSTPYVAGTDHHILKWKPPRENTIDFRLQIASFPTAVDDDGEYEDWDAKPDVHLLVNHGGADGYRFFAPLSLTDAEWDAMKRMGRQFDGRIIECYRDPDSRQWRPKLEPDGTPRFRDDKTDANHISVVQSVIESINDAVSEQDLIAAAGQIRFAYKARAEKQRAEQADRQKREAAKGA